MLYFKNKKKRSLKNTPKPDYSHLFPKVGFSVSNSLCAHMNQLEKGIFLKDKSEQGLSP
jgi:hypothetical protein